MNRKQTLWDVYVQVWPLARHVENCVLIGNFSTMAEVATAQKQAGYYS